MFTREKMDVVLKARMNGKSREECAKLARIPLQKITHWYNEGKQGIGKDNIYFYRALTKIEDAIQITTQYGEDIDIYNRHDNIIKRDKFLYFIKSGEKRKDASRKANVDLKLVTKWDSLGRKGIYPFSNFHKDYTDARDYAVAAEQKQKEKIKRETVNLIKKGLTLEQAAKKVNNGKNEKTIINWYNMGRSGDKNHAEFYRQCESAKRPPVNTNIFAPLPPEWVEYFDGLPMNKTGIAWVSKIGNKWIYQRQDKGKSIRFTNPNIRKLHKEVINNNQIWGIRNQTLAKQAINGYTPASTSVKHEKVTVKYKRLNKNEFKAIAQGKIEHNEVSKVINKLKFFEVDIENMQTRKVKGKTQILIELRLNTSLLNKFESIVKDLGWEIVND